jgi:alkanesulfonate monooxygenase SsuD/methylene tetrahydromethanopterin reductase-like flavin-dependent oxidoreductase (luciferase family)
MAEALYALSDGRFVIGLGLGWNDEEHARFGIPFPSVAGRVGLLEETIARVREVFGPVHTPLLIGGAGPNSTLPLVARHADEWNMTTTSVDLFRARSDRLDELCAEVERDPRTIQRSIAAGILIGRNSSELRERSARMQQVVPALTSVHLDEVGEAARARGWLVGTPSQVVEELRALSTAGVDRTILGHYDLEDVAALELIAEQVVPGLA